MKAKMMMKKMGKSSKKGGMHKMPDGEMMKDSAMKKMNMGGAVKGYSKGGGTTSTVQVRGVGAARGRTAKIC